MVRREHCCRAQVGRRRKHCLGLLFYVGRQQDSDIAVPQPCDYRAVVVTGPRVNRAGRKHFQHDTIIQRDHFPAYQRRPVPVSGSQIGPVPVNGRLDFVLRVRQFQDLVPLEHGAESTDVVLVAMR